MIAPLLAALAMASAPACPSDPQASAAPRVVAVPALAGLKLGKVNYADAVALADHELALTFDDGPDDDHTRAVLDILDRHCIKATFFLVGQEVDADPVLVRTIAERGHSLAAHTYTHPERLGALPLEARKAEIDRSFAAISDALAAEPAEVKARAVRFFRFPELVDDDASLAYLREKSVTVFSADYGIDDWTEIGPDELLRRAIAFTEERRKGVIVLHDFNPNMIAMLDQMITTLEARGYRFVQIVQAGG